MTRTITRKLNLRADPAKINGISEKILKRLQPASAMMPDFFRNEKIIAEMMRPLSSYLLTDTQRIAEQSIFAYHNIPLLDTLKYSPKPVFKPIYQETGKQRIEKLEKRIEVLEAKNSSQEPPEPDKETEH